MSDTSPVTATKAAIIARASRDKDKWAKSVGEQLTECREDCGRNDLYVPKGAEYIDNDYSASRFRKLDRPEWDRFLADFGRSGYDVIVFWDTSRGSRELGRWSDFLDLCRERGTLIHVVTHRHTYDMRVRRDWKALAEDGLDNADESEKISERVRRGWNGSAQMGRPHGIAPCGYEVRYDPRDPRIRSWIIAEPAATIVREIVSRVADGDTIGGIATDLNRRRVPPPTGGWSAAAVRAVGTNPAFAGKHDPAAVKEILKAFPDESLRTPDPKQYNLRSVQIRDDLNARDVDAGRTGSGWMPQEVRRIASNPAYAGLLVRHTGDLAGQVMQGDWPPIIDSRDLEVLAAWSDVCRRARKRLEDRAGTRPGKAKYLLSRLVACGVCGGVLTTRASRARNLSGDLIRMYYCTHGHVAWSVPEMDVFFEEALVRHLAQKEGLRRRLVADRDTRSADLAAAEARVDELTRRLGDYRDKAIAGTIPADDFEVIGAGIRAQIREAEDAAALTPRPRWPGSMRRARRGRGRSWRCPPGGMRCGAW
jgi:DNA invertase Pin-like site-specific DNA recombinase